MTHKENIRAILECYFTGFKEDIIDSACNRILEQEPIIDKLRAEIEQEYTKFRNKSDIWNERACGLGTALEIIDKCKAESEDEG